MLEGELALVAGAIDVARELGRPVDARAVLLAALRDEGDDDASRAALERSGISIEALASGREGAGAQPTGTVGLDVRQLTSAAAGHALADGRRTPTATDVLVVMLWGDPTSSLRRWLEEAGATAEALADALSEHGVALPELPLPRWVDVDAGPRVVFPAEHLDRVLEHAAARLGVAYAWGWNVDERDPSVAWVDGEAAADLPALVAEVLDADEFEVRPADRATERIDARLMESRG